jgi:DNA invertase Pin-like site-specific DNA recombinase
MSCRTLKSDELEITVGELIGYARVSSAGQKLDVQVQALANAGVQVEHLYQEKVSGTKRDGRKELDDLLSRGVRKGDTLVVTRLDRLARSSRDLHNIAHMLTEKGVGLKVLEQNIDTTTPEGRMFFTMLSAVAEFETEIRKGRQREGIDAALAKGTDSPFKGRPATIDPVKVRAMKGEGMTPSAIAVDLGIARSSVYRMLSDT